MIFVNSMSDLFHDDIPESYILQVAEIMRRGDWHTYQVLTKRAVRLAGLLKTRLAKYAQLRHMWWGVSVEDRRHGLPRIDELRSAPASVRFLSIEPLLEDLGEVNLSGIHWVIVGGESGHGARAMDPSWVKSIQKQCAQARVPFFFKQWGGVHKKRAGRKLEGRTWDELPHVPRVLMPA
jgi:protein gp37